MKTTERFEKAVTKLYTAFHEGTLNQMDSCRCAVGNLLMHGNWTSFANSYSITGRKCLIIDGGNRSGYSGEELYKIENLFLDNPNTKEGNFIGLCEIVKYLCKLDGIPNVMDYSSLFEYDEQGATKQLKEVF